MTFTILARSFVPHPVSNESPLHLPQPTRLHPRDHRHQSLLPLITPTNSTARIVAHTLAACHASVILFRHPPTADAIRFRAIYFFAWRMSEWERCFLLETRPPPELTSIPTLPWLFTQSSSSTPVPLHCIQHLQTLPLLTVPPSPYPKKPASSHRFEQRQLSLFLKLCVPRRYFSSPMG